MTDVLPISVVIPAYNAEDFIGEALESVHAQTWPISEIIVVDDGSSDRTAEIAQSLGALVIRQQNRGISAARNVGIRAATEPWIAFLDADDIWQPEKIEYQWAAIELYPDVGLVSCDLTCFRDRSMEGNLGADELGQTDPAEVVDKHVRNKYVPKIQANFLVNGMNYGPSTMLIRRDLLLSVGLFDEHQLHNEEFECFLRVVAHCALVIVRHSFVKYRIHGRNSSNKNRLETNLSFIKLIDQLGAQPGKYPPGAAQVFEADSRRLFLPVGRLLLDEGRMYEARALFTRSLRLSFSWRAILFWCLTFMSPFAFERLLSIKRKLSKKKYRSSRKVLA